MPVPHHSVFLQVRCSSWCPINSVKALKANHNNFSQQKHTCMLLSGVSVYTMLQFTCHYHEVLADHTPWGHGRQCCSGADSQVQKLSLHRRTEFFPLETHGLLTDDRTAHRRWRTPWRSRADLESGMSRSNAATHKPGTGIRTDLYYFCLSPLLVVRIQSNHPTPARLCWSDVWHFRLNSTYCYHTVCLYLGQNLVILSLTYLGKILWKLPQQFNCSRANANVWLQHVLRHEILLHDITEGRMTGKATRGRKRMNLLSDPMKGKYVALKRTAEDRKKRQKLLRNGSHTPASQQITWWYYSSASIEIMPHHQEQ